MVNLVDVPLRDDRREDRPSGSARTAPRRHGWRGRSRRDMHHTEPTSLLQLEELAQKTVEVMERHVAKSEHNYHKAMDLLRLQYNMNFMILCEKCSGPHMNDEILAPER